MQQKQRPAVVHADFAHRPLQAESALNLRKSGDLESGESA
jgi:hypothetical protein